MQQIDWSRLSERESIRANYSCLFEFQIFRHACQSLLLSKRKKNKYGIFVKGGEYWCYGNVHQVFYFIWHIWNWNEYKELTSKTPVFRWLGMVTPETIEERTHVSGTCQGLIKGIQKSPHLCVLWTLNIETNTAQLKDISLYIWDSVCQIKQKHVPHTFGNFHPYGRKLAQRLS